jgi:NhaP-type Na+/H+ or K+/H+ antiporter
VTGTLILAALVVAYALTAARIEYLYLTGPIVFAVVGFVLGSGGSAVVEVGPGSEVARLATAVTLSLLLFSDAATIKPRILAQDAGMITRLLLIGLPLTVALGTGAARFIVPALGLGVCALLAAILAPTDLSLGLAMFKNPRVPELVRGAINVESGLNDGIAAPLVTLFLGVAIAEFEHLTRPFVEAIVEIVLGVGVGGAIGLVGGLLLRSSQRAKWSTASSRQFAVLALVMLAYGVAVEIHGNGFIAAFVGGLAFGIVARDTAHEAVRLSERTGTLLTFGVWFVFGASVAPTIISDGLTWRPIVYALLSLTLVRMVPVALSLLGKKLHGSTLLFVGWFGPRGLASVVFLIIALQGLREAGIETTLLITTAGWTVLLSVILHGISAGPVAAWYAARAERFAPGSPELEPTASVSVRHGLPMPTSSHPEK